MGLRINPSTVAANFRKEIIKDLETLDKPLTLAGILTTDAKGPSKTYADYTRAGCEDVGINFDLRTCDPFAVEDEISSLNNDANIHGLIIYYPVFNLEQDNYIKDLICPEKDVEGLSSHWLRMLYSNIRTVADEPHHKAILPCTPLAIVKLLEEAFTNMEKPFKDKTVTIFNRSEVVGRPLAAMLANDGARVFSLDIDSAVLIESGKSRRLSLDRKKMLSESDIVITGVPTKEFPHIQPGEISDDCVCVNFSTVKNYSEAAKDKAAVFIPRVGPMTVTMALRNTLRLFKNFSGETYVK